MTENLLSYRPRCSSYTWIGCALGISVSTFTFVTYRLFYQELVSFVIRSFSQSAISSHQHGISISPKIVLQLEWSHYVMIVIYMVMILDVLPSEIFLKCFTALLVLTNFQLLQYTWMIFHRQAFLSDQLTKAWQVAYERDPWTIRQMEDQWQCVGFHHALDRHIHPVNDHIALEQGCYLQVEHHFGDMIYQWAIVIWVIKYLQAMGGLACYGLYRRYNNPRSKENDYPDLEILSKNVAPKSGGKY